MQYRCSTGVVPAVQVWCLQYVQCLLDSPRPLVTPASTCPLLCWVCLVCLPHSQRCLPACPFACLPFCLPACLPACLLQVRGAHLPLHLPAVWPGGAAAGGCSLGVWRLVALPVAGQCSLSFPAVLPPSGHPFYIYFTCPAFGAPVALPAGLCAAECGVRRHLHAGKARCGGGCRGLCWAGAMLGCMR